MEQLLGGSGQYLQLLIIVAVERIESVGIVRNHAQQPDSLGFRNILCNQDIGEQADGLFQLLQLLGFRLGIDGITLYKVLFQHLVRPDAELRGVFGVDTITYRQNHIKIIGVDPSFHPTRSLLTNYFHFGNSYLVLQLSALENITDMFGNCRNFRSEQLRNLRLRQPYAVALHADLQTGLAVGRPVNDDLPVVYTNKYRKIRLHLKIFRHLDFSPKIAIFVLSCREIRRPRRRNGQAGARPCKMTVGDAGTEAEEPSQFIDIHRTYIRAEAPLSALLVSCGRLFVDFLWCETFRHTIVSICVGVGARACRHYDRCRPAVVTACVGQNARRPIRQMQ